MTRARDIADTQENNGGGVAPFVAGKNAIINAAMDIWQRGTSFTAQGYTSDRWFFASGAVGRTITRQSSALTGFTYCQRVARDSGNTATNAMSLRQSLESVNSLIFAGKTVTMSFWARAGANYSPASGGLVAQLKSGTGTDQNSAVSYTGEVNVINQTATLTTSWQQFSYTGTVGSTATELSAVLIAIPVGTAGAADYFEVTGVQLEAGNVATPFTTASGSFAGELALCQRYYQKSYPIEIAPGAFFLGGYSVAIIQSAVPDGLYYNYQRLITRMRVAPTLVIYSGSGALNRMSTVSASDLAASSALTNSISDNGFGITNNSGTTLAFSSGGYLFYYTASAEL
jgi:hypothetical protein